MLYLIQKVIKVLLCCMSMCVCSVAQLCLTLWCLGLWKSLSGSIVHGIFQERILKRVAISSSRRSSQPSSWTHISCIAMDCSKIWHWRTEWSRAKANRVLPRECAGRAFSSNNTREDSTHGHQQMVSTKIRLIILFAAKDGEALYSQQKLDQELTVARIINSLLPNSDLNWRK